MKILISPLVSLLIATSCLTAITDPRLQAAMSTLPQNILLDRISFDSTPICNGFWQKHGYVCNPQATLRFNQHDQSTFSRITDKFIQMLNMLEDINLKAYVYLQRKTPYQGVLELKTYSKDKAAKISEAEYCWNNLRKFRSSAICFTCSARSYNFYQDNLGLISMPDCYKMIFDCSHHFARLDNLGRALEGLVYVAQEFAKQFPGNDALLAEVKWRVSNVGSKHRGRIGKLIKDMTLARAYRNMDDVHSISKSICEQSISLQRIPVLLAYYLVAFRPIELLYTKLNQGRLLIKNRGSRALIDLEADPESFKQEISVIRNPHANLQTVGHNSKIPMNLSMTFP